MVRQQFVCVLIGNAAPRLLFSGLLISIGVIRETLIPGVDIGASKWFFHRRTEALDWGMLAMLAKSLDRSRTVEVSINLNVSTLLSKKFMQYDNSIDTSTRGFVVVDCKGRTSLPTSTPTDLPKTSAMNGATGFGLAD